MALTTFSNDDALDATALNGNFDHVLETCFKYLDGDTTGGSDTGTSEAEIGEVQIPADTVTTGVLVFAYGDWRDGGNNSNNCVIELTAGTSTDGTANATKESITVYGPSSNAANESHPWTIIYYINDLTWTSTNYVHITGNNNAGATVSCAGIQVIYL